MDSLESRILSLLDGISPKSEFDVPLDYFSWGRDRRHCVDNTERLPLIPNHARTIKRKLREFFTGIIKYVNYRKGVLSQFRNRYMVFDESYQLMSDQFSRELFAELILMKLLTEKGMRLSSFTKDFIESYERASNEILECRDKLQVYRWVLRKIQLQNPPINFFYGPYYAESPLQREALSLSAR